MCQEYFEVNKNNMKNRIVLIQKSKTYVNIRICMKTAWSASIEKTLSKNTKANAIPARKWSDIYWKLYDTLVLKKHSMCKK